VISQGVKFLSRIAGEGDDPVLDINAPGKMPEAFFFSSRVLALSSYPLSNHPDSPALSYMNIIHAFHDNNSLDCLITRAYINNQAVG
jgi:hypothetical protein